jgi:hypothetical protein
MSSIAASAYDQVSPSGALVLPMRLGHRILFTICGVVLVLLVITSPLGLYWLWATFRISAKVDTNGISFNWFFRPRWSASWADIEEIRPVARRTSIGAIPAAVAASLAPVQIVLKNGRKRALPIGAFRDGEKVMEEAFRHNVPGVQQVKKGEEVHYVAVDRPAPEGGRK